jgi:Ca2+-binding EF-hand superfamily protein
MTTIDNQSSSDYARFFYLLDENNNGILEKNEIKDIDKLIQEHPELKEEAERLKEYLFNEEGELTELGNKIAGEDGLIGLAELMRLDTNLDGHISDAEFDAAGDSDKKHDDPDDNVPYRTG